ncbi:MAG: NAD(P)/FAD-dependent oxidoreductase [Thermodesulfovibrionales bacterium]
MNNPSVGFGGALESASNHDGRGTTVVFGGGLAGLSAGYVLAAGGRRALVFEADSSVGGLSKTVVAGDYRFDIGGHRFFTKDKAIEDLVRTLMSGELVEVCRSSKIYLNERFFDYPLRPANALSGMGLLTTARILLDYGVERFKWRLGMRGEVVSLEDWVVRNFGRTLFNIYFREYSEKVWGLDCGRISQHWVERRIQGLSLSTAIRNAFFKMGGKKIPTLADCFLYPELGIGRLSERLSDEITAAGGSVFTGAGVRRVFHEGGRVLGAEIAGQGGSGLEVRGDEFISTIPLTGLVRMLEPAAPPEVLEAASGLGYRDLVIAAVMVDRERVTDQSWIYIPEKKIPFGRMHEPKNWSAKMAPAQSTLLVVEYFCFKGDDIWSADDGELSRMTAEGLEKLGFIRKEEVLDTVILRVPRAYPLFEVGYERHVEKLYGYIEGFENLYIAGRAGMFKYHNMDHAMDAGMKVAEKILAGRGRGR